MGTVSKIGKTLATAITKVSGVTLTGVSKIIEQTLSLFADTKAVSKSITTGEENSIFMESSEGSVFNFTETTAWTISFWVRAGWVSNLNTNIHFFHLNEVGSTGTRNEMFRIYYNESNNRLYYEFGHNNSNYRRNFWLFHSNSGNYATAYSAAGLGTTYWSASNRGNVGEDNFTMITMAFSSTDSGASAHATAYWNASTLGIGYYASGDNKGDPAMDASQDRQVAIGMNVANLLKSGNSAATVYNDLTVWDKQLSADEVSELYNGGTRMDATTHTSAANLKAYYTFESGEGDDTSGQSAPQFAVNGDSSIITY